MGFRGEGTLGGQGREQGALSPLLPSDNTAKTPRRCCLMKLASWALASCAAGTEAWWTEG